MRLATLVGLLFTFGMLVGCETAQPAPTPDIAAMVAATIEAAYPTATPAPTLDIPATVTAAVQAALPTPAPLPDIPATVRAQVQATIAAISTPNQAPTSVPVHFPTAAPTGVPAPSPTSRPVATMAPRLPTPTIKPNPSPTHVTTPTITCSPTIVTRIDGQFEGWDGDTIFQLLNGQIWQQDRYAYTYSYRFSPEVLIFPVIGGCEMQVEGVSSTIRVRRLK